MKLHYYLDDKTVESTSVILTIRTAASKQKSFRIGTGISIKTKDWNFESERLRRNSSGFSDINHRLDTIASAVQGYHDTAVRLLHVDPAPYIKQQLLNNKFLNRVEKVEAKKIQFVLECYETFIEEKSRVNARNTILVLQTTLNHLRKNIRTTTTFDEFVTREFASKYKTYLFKNFTNNTIRKHLAILKRFLHWATKNKYNTNKDFAELFQESLKVEVETIALTPAEIKSIESLDLSKNPGLHNTRILFLIGVYLCQRVSDVCAFDPKKHVVGNEIRMMIKKTDRMISLPIIPQLASIIKAEEWYVVSEQVANRNIKDVARLAGINQPTERGRQKGGERIVETKPRYEFVTINTARSTGITYLLRMGVDRGIVQKISGHRNSKSFDRYVRFVDEDVTRAMLDAWKV